MQPKLLLINPTSIVSGRKKINAAGFVTMEPLSLAYVAALTPSNWQIEIADEVVGDDWEKSSPDLVGITCLTQTAPRAYEIAAHWRSRGVPVVLGGIHATMCPDEASQYVDVICNGEAESSWPQIIKDFEQGSLKKHYQGQSSSLVKLPLPRRDLYKRRYHVGLVSASRGCRNRCEFCAIWKFSFGHYRTRPVEAVLEELRYIPRTFILLFTDDNIMMDRDYSLSLFQKMAEFGLQRRHAVQASLNIADDDELLSALKRSGCFMVLVGLESISEKTLKFMRKGVNLKVGVEQYKAKIERLHAYGLCIAGTFILGFDGDTPDVFNRTARFVVDSGVDLAHFGLLNPTPGTDVYDRLEREGRLLFTDFPSDHALYDLNRAVFTPLTMSTQEMEAGLDSATRQICSWPVATRRAVNTWRNSNSLSAALISLFWTRLGLHNRVFGGRT